MTANTQSYKDCIYFAYCKYCKKPYIEEKKKYGYADLTEFPCKKEKCEEMICVRNEKIMEV